MMAPREPDVVVVGAGAAGLAAAKTARSLGLSVTLLEAKSRIGGRAFTDRASLGLPWDRGAHWLQNARHNLFRRFADEMGFAYETAPPRHYLWSKGAWASGEFGIARDAYFERAFAAIAQAGEAGRDIPASEVLPPGERFRAMFDSWFAALSGAETDHYSTLDHARYAAGDANWPVRAGYGALVARYAEGIPVALSTPAGHLRWRGKDIAVETPGGTVRGRAAIVTLSTNVLAAGGLAFDPPLPAVVRDALASLPVGAAEKVAFAFSRDVFGLEDTSQLHFVHDTLEAIRFQIRPFGRNLAIGYLAGRFARALERDGTASMIAFAKDKLIEVFGHDISSHLTGAAATRWSSDPHIRGGYSHALPGKADAREILAQPIGGGLFLAGEACSRIHYGTVHGAYESGVAAAKQAAAYLAGRRT